MTIAPLLAPDVTTFNPFVVFGASKSGTTWVQRICDAHPDARCHFQRRLFPIAPGTRRTLFAETTIVYNEQSSPFGGVFEGKDAERRYMLEQTLLQRSDVLYADFVERAVGRLSDPGDLAFARDLHHRMLRGMARELLCDVPGRRIYGTKAYTDLDLLFDVFPDARVVHIVRDGRDVCVSKRFHTLRQKAFYLGDERSRALRMLNRFTPTRAAVFAARRYAGVFGRDWFRDDPRPLFNAVALRKFALDWKMIVEYIREHARARPDRFITLKYEDLRARPEAEYGRLFDFLGVDSAPSTVAKVIAGTKFELLRSTSGGAAGFFRKGEAGDWRNHFSPADVRLFDELAGGLLRELGYQ